MTIQILKLTNGDTILGDIIDADEKTLTLLNPLELHTEPFGGNRANMVAHQWLPMMEDRNIIYVSQAHVVGSMPANIEIVDYYKHAIEVILFPEQAKMREEQERREWEKLIEGMKELTANTNGVLH